MAPARSDMGTERKEKGTEPRPVSSQPGAHPHLQPGRAGVVFSDSVADRPDRYQPDMLPILPNGAEAGSAHNTSRLCCADLCRIGAGLEGVQGDLNTNFPIAENDPFVHGTISMSLQTST